MGGEEGIEFSSRDSDIEDTVKVWSSWAKVMGLKSPSMTHQGDR